MKSLEMQFTNPAWQDFWNDEPGDDYVPWCVWYDVDTRYPIVFDNGTVSFVDAECGVARTMPVASLREVN